MNTQSKTPKTTSTSTIISYGVLGLPLSLLSITYFVYLPKFYADVAGVSLSSIGLLLLCTRIWDALTDPLIGKLSDNTDSRWGRRKPWILISSLPLVFFFTLLLIPSARPEYISASTWFGVNSFFFFLFWTTLSIPYEALGAEISPNYKERIKLLGFRDGALVLGTLLAGIIPALVFVGPEGINSEESYSEIAKIYSFCLILTAAACLYFVKERPTNSKKSIKVSLKESILHTFSNRPFLILLTAYTVSALGAGLPPVLMPFYLDYWLGIKDPSLYLVLYFLVGFILLPFWLYLASRIGKKKAWLAAMCINTGAFAGVYFIGKGDTNLYMLLACISGVGYGASLALPSAMQADVIDLDELQHNTRKEGQFIGFWSIAKKLAAAIGGGLALTLLDWSGYVANREQSESTLSMLRLLYAGVPCICNFIAILIAWNYPIDEKMHNQIRVSLDARKIQ